MPSEEIEQVYIGDQETFVPRVSLAMAVRMTGGWEGDTPHARGHRPVQRKQTASRRRIGWSCTLLPTCRGGASRDGGGDHDQAAGGCMHIRVPHTKAARQQFKHVTATSPPPEVQVREQHTIIRWKQDRKTVATKIVHHRHGVLGMWIEARLLGPEAPSGAQGAHP